MKRSSVVPAAAILATAVGLGAVLGYHPSGGGATASLPASVKVGATAGVGAGASAVGTDQALAPAPTPAVAPTFTLAGRPAVAPPLG